MRTKSTGRSRMLGVLLAVCVALGLAAVPGVAAAAPPHVSPVLDCYRQNTDGSYTVVLGYENTHQMTWTHNYGSDNSLTPARLQGSQPTQFQTGVHKGVLSLQLTKAEVSTFRWVLGQDVLDYRAAASAPQCPAPTPLPVLGNGTGLAIALLAGGLFGVFFVRRMIRRATATATAATTAGTDG